MLSRVVYVSGIHGSGKSTFIKALCSNRDYISHKREYKIESDDPYVRALWKLLKYYIEANEHFELAKENSVVIADRCVYDNFSYLNGFLDLGWVTQKQIVQHEIIYNTIFLENLRPKNVIFMYPPVDWVKNRLIERWQTRGIKWRENNFDYLNVVYSKFIDFYSSFKGNLLIIQETDLEERVSIATKWISKIVSNNIPTQNNL